MTHIYTFDEYCHFHLSYSYWGNKPDLDSKPNDLQIRFNKDHLKDFLGKPEDDIEIDKSESLKLKPKTKIEKSKKKKKVLISPEIDTTSAGTSYLDYGRTLGKSIGY